MRDAVVCACWLALLQVLFDIQASSIRPGVERSLFTGQVEVSSVYKWPHIS
jgi:hypothetical protein